jgi:hypothetical protein
MSNLLVQNIKHTNNTTSMSIDTSGQVSVRGESSATTTNLQQGLCKHWVHHNDGASIDDSFNNTSLTDGGTGNYTTTIANDFNNTGYTKAITGGGTSGANGDDCYVGNSSVATGSYGMYARDEDGTRKDTQLSSMLAWGDLA